MKILHIHFGTSLCNGIVSVVTELCAVQNIHGHEALIGTIGNPIPWEDKHMVSVAKFDQFIQTLNTLGPDIVIFHSIYNRKYIRYARYLRQRLIPYAIVFHGAGSLINYQRHKWRKKLAHILFFDTFIRRAKGIIFLNEKEKVNNTLKHLNDRQYIIPNGINLPQAFNKQFLQSDKVRFAFLGRIANYHKGIDILLDAIRLIAKTEYANKIHITFYGTPENRYFEQSIAQFASFVEYKGPVYGAEKRTAYMTNDIFLLTSRLEGMPMGVLEALSYGLPCLITPQTNMGTIIQRDNAGWVVDLDAEKIAKGIITAAEAYSADPEGYFNRARMSVVLFDWENIGPKSIEVYKTILRQ